MKTFLFISIALIIACADVFSQQCPQSGLKIITPVCDSPKNLQANATCEKLLMKWKGNKEQEYIVKATITDPSTNGISEAEAADNSCDDNGNCSATIPVKEGMIVNWSVQSICIINGATLYSPEVEGEEVVIPYCNSISGNAKKENMEEAIRVYPNPTTGYLTVEYLSKTNGNVQLNVFDMTGKKVFSDFTNAAKGNNTYSIDLHNLSPGNYILKINKQTGTTQVKFILLNNE